MNGRFSRPFRPPACVGTGPNKLLRNDGGGVFTDVTPSVNSAVMDRWYFEDKESVRCFARDMITGSLDNAPENNQVLADMEEAMTVDPDLMGVSVSKGMHTYAWSRHAIHTYLHDAISAMGESCSN